MIVIPAIDLLNNNAVRLYQGDYENSTIYSDSPWELVAKFERSGATLIHIVDLDGAKKGIPSNSNSIRRIREYSNVELELGGGIRTMDTIAYYDSLGIHRFIIGTAAVQDFDFLNAALNKYGEDRIVVGVDARDGFVNTQGWETNSGLRYEEFLSKLDCAGIKHIIFTDITLDGTLKGPNLQSYDWILRNFNFQLIASGGVSSIEDIKNLYQLRGGQMYGAITGKAIYENRFELSHAIDICKKLGD